MGKKDTNTQVGATSQLSENKGGLKSFSNSSPLDVAQGGGSLLDSDKFGSREAIDNRDASRFEINTQVKENRKKERATRVGYRSLMRKGDGAGALRLLNDAEGAGVHAFGIRQHGSRERQADSQIRGKRRNEVAAGTRKSEPGVDFFQRDMGGVQSGKAQGQAQGQAPAFNPNDPAAQETPMVGGIEIGDPASRETPMAGGTEIDPASQETLMTGGTAFSPEEALNNSEDGPGIFTGRPRGPVSFDDVSNIFGNSSNIPSLQQFNELAASPLSNDDAARMKEDPVGFMFPNVKRDDALVDLKKNIFVDEKDTAKIKEDRNMNAFKSETKGKVVTNQATDPALKYLSKAGINLGKSAKIVGGAVVDGPLGQGVKSVSSLNKSIRDKAMSQVGKNISAAKSIPTRSMDKFNKGVNVADKAITEFGGMLDDILESSISN